MALAPTAGNKYTPTSLFTVNLYSDSIKKAERQARPPRVSCDLHSLDTIGLVLFTSMVNSE